MDNIAETCLNNDYNELRQHNNIETRINNKINEESLSYINLINFLKAFEINKLHVNYQCMMNICNVYSKKTYSINKESDIGVFMDLLEKCRREGLKLNFTEKQSNNIDSNSGSGMMFDFDILSPNQESISNKVNFEELVYQLFTIINDMEN